MKLRSFRTRIALALALLAGSALVGFGVTSWWLIYNAKVSRLDEAMKSQLMRSGRPQSPEQWQFYEALLPRIVGIDAETPIALRVIGRDGSTRYQSSHWPTDLKVNGLSSSRAWSSPPPFLPPSQPSLDSDPKPDDSERQFSSDRPPKISPSLPQPRFVTQQTSTET